MSEAFINISHSASGAGSATDWYDVMWSDGTIRTLGSTGWTFQLTTPFSGIPGGNGTEDGGTGDADWTIPFSLFESARGSAVAQWAGLDDAKTYTVYATSSYTLSGRSSSWTVNGGGTPQITNDFVGGSPNTTESAIFTDVSPSGGVITLERVNADGSSDSYAAAMGIVEHAPSVSLDNNPQLGATLSGTYANFGGAPTGPVQFDQGARSLPDEAITVDSGAGTWVTDTALTGLPANGESVTPFPVIGSDIDITLPDPGA